MTSHSLSRFVINTGTASLALLLAVGAPSALAEPSSSASVSSTSSPSASASQTPAPSESPTVSESASAPPSASAKESATQTPAPAVPSSPQPTSTLEKASKAPATSAAASASSAPATAPSSAASSPSATPTSSGKASAVSSSPTQQNTPVPSAAQEKDTQQEQPKVQVQADTAVRPGETYQGTILQIPEKQHVTLRLLSPAGTTEDALPCTVQGQGSSATFNCEIPKNLKSGKYTLEIAFLDEQNQPVQNNGQPVIDTSHRVYIADVDKNYNPQILAQYPVTAAGYVMPIAGGGYEPNSTVTISALDDAGQQIPGVSFTGWVENGVPSTEALAGAQDTLTVQTDANGAFKAYVVTNPYMSSSSVKITATDTKNKISSTDALGILGESVAELSTSVESIVAGDNQPVTISGSKFAPSYTNYPVLLQLVRDGQVITDEKVELAGPSGDNLWSSFDAVTLTDTASLEAGEYSLQAVVPNDGSIPVEFRGRVLASKALTVTAPVVNPSPTASPSESASPEPSSPATGEPQPTASGEPSPAQPAEPVATDKPEPVASAETSEPAQQPQPQEPTPTSAAPTPSESTVTAEPEAPASSEPAVLERSNTPVMETVPLLKQEKKPEATESALNQNPTWIQASSIKAEDPRVEKEPNQQLKSSVLNAQGSKNAQGRFDPTNGSSLPGATDAANNASAVVNLNKSLPWWPILLLLVVALLIGTVTGMFISRTSKNQDDAS